jgi:hypothetical protein
VSAFLVRFHSRLRPARGRHVLGYQPEPWVRMVLLSQVDVFTLQLIGRYGLPYKEIA